MLQLPQFGPEQLGTKQETFVLCQAAIAVLTINSLGTNLVSSGPGWWADGLMGYPLL